MYNGRMAPTAIKSTASFLNSWLPYRFAQTTHPGLVVRVVHKGKTIFHQSLGYAATDSPQHIPMRHNQLFGIASQSKMFTAVAIMQLQEHRKLGLDVPIVTYLPWLSAHPHAAMQEITVRQLLCHSSGLARDLPEADFWLFEKPFPSQQELRSLLLQSPVLIEPNTKLKYSNAGYALLGQIIEATSDQTYSDYITEHIIRPLGPSNTYADYRPELSTATATGYGVPLAGVRQSFGRRQSTATFACVAGALSTAQDMCTFVTALHTSKKLLRHTSRKELLRTHWTQPDGYDAGSEFGMGVEISYIGGKRLIGHSGHIAGHLSATYFDPTLDIAVSVMGNSKDTPSAVIATGIIETCTFFAEYATRRCPKATTRFAGRFFSPIAAIEFVATADTIVAIDPDDWQPFGNQESLTPDSSDTLRITTHGSIFNEAETVQYTFIRDEVASIRFAGNTLRPEKLYHAHIKNRP